MIEIVGSWVSTVQLAVAVALLPAASVARTRKSCDPSARPLGEAGELQAAKAPPSRLHSSVAPGSAEKAMLAEALALGSAGAVSTWTAGGVVSSVRARLADQAETAPSASLERACQ